MDQQAIPKMQRLETDQQLITSRLGNAAFGRSKIIYLPLALAIGSFMIMVYVLFDGLLQTLGIGVFLAILALFIVCIVAIILIYKRDIAFMKQNTTKAMVCFAQTITGNEREYAYSAIYTTGDLRHNADFIKSIANRILALENPSTPDEKKVRDLFRPDFIKPGEFAKQLPLSFTDNVVVYRKQFVFTAVPAPIRQQIDNDGGLFVAVALREENANFCKEFYQ